MRYTAPAFVQYSRNTQQLEHASVCAVCSMIRLQLHAQALGQPVQCELEKWIIWWQKGEWDSGAASGSLLTIQLADHPRRHATHTWFLP